jgi:hypothetical protein
MRPGVALISFAACASPVTTVRLVDTSGAEFVRTCQDGCVVSPTAELPPLPSWADAPDQDFTLVGSDDRFIMINPSRGAFEDWQRLVACEIDADCPHDDDQSEPLQFACRHAEVARTTTGTVTGLCERVGTEADSVREWATYNLCVATFPRPHHDTPEFAALDQAVSNAVDVACARDSSPSGSCTLPLPAMCAQP